VEEIQYSYKYVIITKFYNKKDSQFRRLIKWNRFSINSNDTELAFNPKDNAFVIEKNKYTCIDNNFIKYINDNKITKIDICGIDTDICVLKCAVDIFELNLVPNILAPLCGSHAGNEYHNVSLKILERFIGKNQVKYEI